MIDMSTLIRTALAALMIISGASAGIAAPARDSGFTDMSQPYAAMIPTAPRVIALSGTTSRGRATSLSGGRPSRPAVFCPDKAAPLSIPDPPADTKPLRRLFAPPLKTTKISQLTSDAAAKNANGAVRPKTGIAGVDA